MLDTTPGLVPRSCPAQVDGADGRMQRVFFSILFFSFFLFGGHVRCLFPLRFGIRLEMLQMDNDAVVL